MDATNPPLVINPNNSLKQAEQAIRIDEVMKAIQSVKAARSHNRWLSQDPDTSKEAEKYLTAFELECIDTLRILKARLAELQSQS